MAAEPPRRAPTQSDIAKAAGVSTATVSRVLNGSPLVRPAVRERIEGVIAKLGYFPHAAARALASRRTYTIGAVIPTLNNAIFAASVNALERELQAARYTLFLAVSNYDLDAEENQARRLVERGIEGIMLVGNAHSPRVYEMLDAAGIPQVNTWAFDPRRGRPNIGFRNGEAAALVVDHLLQLGHKRIGMVVGIVEGNDRARDRLAAVRKRLAAHGLALVPEATMEAEYAISAGRAAMTRILETGVMPTALIGGNDVLALGLLFEAQDRGIAVPEQLSITGFDNLSLTEHIRPSLTTVDVPATEMGHLAARALLKSIEGRGRPRSQRLAAPLLVRETTAPPPRGTTRTQKTTQ
jgi:LacI family transcriptional regulator